MVPSCISSFRFGSMIEIVGRLVKSVGKALNGWLEAAGTFVKFTQGACFSAYAPEVQTVEPAAGRSSENPVNV